MAIISDDIKRTILQKILGPEGGLFAFGNFTGLAIMYFFMAGTFIAELKDNHQAQIGVLNTHISELNTRVGTLEQENTRFHKRLEEIALRRIED